jgi:hypothetical protein
MHHKAPPSKQPEILANAPRCGARTRSGHPCRSPAVNGNRRCRMHGGKGGGAPRGNRNAWKHGLRSAWVRSVGRYLRATSPAAIDRHFGGVDAIHAPATAGPASPSPMAPIATGPRGKYEKANTQPHAPGKGRGNGADFGASWECGGLFDLPIFRPPPE